MYRKMEQAPGPSGTVKAYTSNVEIEKAGGALAAGTGPYKSFKEFYEAYQTREGENRKYQHFLQKYAKLSEEDDRIWNLCYRYGGPPTQDWGQEKIDLFEKFKTESAIYKATYPDEQKKAEPEPEPEPKPQEEAPKTYTFTFRPGRRTIVTPSKENEDSIACSTSTKEVIVFKPTPKPENKFAYRLWD